MPIDVKLYAEHIDGALYFNWWAGQAAERLKASGDVERHWASAFQEEVEKTSERETLGAWASERATEYALAVHRRHEENVARATYIYAWSGLEHLLGSCVEDLCRWEPQRIVRHHEKKAVQLLAAVISGKRTQSELLEEVVQTERRNFGARTFERQREYFEKVWGVLWEQEWFDQLFPIDDCRNAAAHHPVFPPPFWRAIAQDLEKLNRIGPQIAGRCLKVMGKKEKP